MLRACRAIVMAWAILGIASASAGQDRDSVRRIMTSAADWQLAHPSEHAPDDWTQAAFYIGVMALAQSTGDPQYADAMRAMGEKNRWRPQVSRSGQSLVVEDDGLLVRRDEHLFYRDSRYFEAREKKAPGRCCWPAAR